MFTLLHPKIRNKGPVLINNTQAKVTRKVKACLAIHD